MLLIRKGQRVVTERTVNGRVRHATGRVAVESDAVFGR